jgi:hypothetical protein
MHSSEEVFVGDVPWAASMSPPPSSQSSLEIHEGGVIVLALREEFSGLTGTFFGNPQK